MAKTSNTVALALVSSGDMVAKDKDLTQLQDAAVLQFERLRSIRHEETLRGLMLGLMLHRIKASLPYGDFGKWIKANNATVKDRWVNYLMRLSLVFVESSKLTKPHLLALPGDQTELSLDGMEGAQRTFMNKAVKFVGEHSLSELLDKHGIKAAKAIGGKREKSKADKPVELDAEAQYQQSRDEIGGALDHLDNLLIKENALQHLAGHDEEITGVVAFLNDLTAKVNKAAKPLIGTTKKGTK